MKIQRYTFEDALIKWGADKGRTEKAAVAMGLMLCSQLNWNKGGVLRWNTQEACKASGISRSTFYRTMPLLREAGFFVLNRDSNYQVSLPETKSHDEIVVSHDETNVSHEDNPFSEVYLFSEEDLIKELDCRREDFPLDALVPFTLISKPARSEHSVMPKYTGQEWMERAEARRQQINAEILAEFGEAI